MEAFGMRAGGSGGKGGAGTVGGASAGGTAVRSPTPARGRHGGFRVLDGPAVERAAGIAPAAAAPALEAMPAVRVTGPSPAVPARGPQADAAAARQAAELLDRLGALQSGLARFDGLPRGMLDDLADSLKVRMEAADPRLREILAAITLRAEIELARHRPLPADIPPVTAGVLDDPTR
jgi:hypothetical protein